MPVDRLRILDRITIGFTHLTMPLLTKDLIEQSMQRRTYVYRALFAVVLYAGGLWIYSNWLSGGIASLGQGADVLLKLMWLQIGATLAVVPLLASGAIAGEKERDTLELLMVTKLSLRGIVIEKFAAHFVSIAVLQLLALPLMALAYPMGGVELTTLIGTFIYLLCAAAIAVAWAIVCSSWSYTTQGALLGYLSLAPLGIVAAVPTGPVQQILLPIVALYGCILLTVGLIVAAQLAEKIVDLREASKELVNPEPEISPTHSIRGSRWYLLVMIPIQFLVPFSGIVAQRFPGVAAGIVTIGITIFTLVLLIVVAPLVLMVRSRRPSWRAPSDVLAAVDLAVKEVNDLATTGIVLTSRANALSHDGPVAWRELQRPAFRLRTLLWSVISVESVLVLVVNWGHNSGIGRSGFNLIWLVIEMLMWVTAIATLCTYSASLFPLERLHQTLAVLLVTPLSAREIVDQKMAGARRMIVAWTIPLVTMWIVRTYLLNPFVDVSSAASRGTDSSFDWSHNASGLLGIFVFPSFVVWLGTYCGLRMNGRVNALLAAVGVIAVLCLMPWLLNWLQRTDLLWLCPLAPLSPEAWPSAMSFDISTTAKLIRGAGLVLAVISLMLAVHQQFSHLVGRLESRYLPADDRSILLVGKNE